jgi:protein O-GlcNAc transferase
MTTSAKRSVRTAADIDTILRQAWKDHEHGKLKEAEAGYRRVLDKHPDHVDALRSLGTLAHSQKDYAQALTWLERALALDPARAQVHVNIADVLRAQDRHDEAVRHYRTAIELKPDFVQAFERLGTTLIAREEFTAAVECYRQLLEVKPDFHVAHHNLGVAFAGLKQFDDALSHHRQVIELKPDATLAYQNAAYALGELGKFEESLEMNRKVLELDPALYTAHASMGVAFYKLKRFDEAADAFREAIAINQDSAQLHSNLGNCLLALKKYDEAITCYLAAIDRKPDLFHAYNGALFVLNYDYKRSVQDNFVLARRYGSAVMANVTPFLHGASDGVRRPLRVGFVSGDLLQHPVGFFIETVLANFDRTRVQPVAYSLSGTEDILTARLRPYFAEWTSLLNRTPRESAEIIHNDKIDILVDLSGHTAKTGLPVFAWRPAPVQATWIGYFATTGVPTMDYFIGDEYVLPVDEESHFVEKPWRLPDGYLCFSPPVEQVDVAALPMIDQGFVTFGCFNKLSKMNDAVVALWSKTLHAVPNSKLMLKSHELEQEAMRDETIRRYAEHGITEDRLILQGRSSRAHYFAQYHQVDIALDPFPYNGGTTTVESLWMGVPVIAKRGDRFSAHMSEGILQHLGHPEWIARDEEEYVAKAVELASDPARLAQIRAVLRDELKASPLYDAPRFSRKLEDAFEGMWQLHCQDTAADPLAFIETQMNAAVEAQQTGRYGDAVQLYRKVLALQPNHADANLNLGVLAFQSGRPADSLPYLKTALEAQPKREDLWAVYVEALVVNKEFDAAEQALKLGRNLGVALAGIDIEAARQSEQMKTAYDTMAAEFAGTLADLRHSGSHEGIVAIAEQMTQLLPGFGLGWKAWAQALIALGRRDEAEHPLERAKALLPLDEEVHSILPGLTAVCR